MIFADTHILIWLAGDQRRISARALESLTSGAKVGISAVVAFEYADLQRRRRLPPAPPLSELIEAFALQLVDFPAQIWSVAERLPPVHGDPVDRMLVAHAIVADAILVTADRHIARYPVRTLW